VLEKGHLRKTLEGIYYKRFKRMNQCYGWMSSSIAEEIKKGGEKDIFKMADSLDYI